MDTSTLVTVGQLAATAAAEWQMQGEDDNRTDGDGGVLGYIPGVPLLNDGRYDYWLPTFGPVVLEHTDGAWRVSSPGDAWFESHALRIEVSALPMADGGSAALDPAVVYEIRYRSESLRSAWDLFRRG